MKPRRHQIPHEAAHPVSAPRRHLHPRCLPATATGQRCNSKCQRKLLCTSTTATHTIYTYTHARTNAHRATYLSVGGGGGGGGGPRNCRRVIASSSSRWMQEGEGQKKKKKSRVIGGGREEKRRLVTAPADPEWLTGGLSGWGCVNYSSPRHLSPAKTDPTRRPDISETTVSGVGGLEGGGTRAR